MNTCPKCETDPLHAWRSWAIPFLLGAVIEWSSLHHKRRHHTLSQITRQIFKTDTDKGKTLFTAAWLIFSFWWVKHINTNAKENWT
jgi:hypothetical protein